MSKKVSYIIVTWNNEGIIEECLDTLYKYAKNLDNEVIVVDNASADQTCAVITQSFKQVKLISLNENVGFSKANNIGLEYATGEYTFFVNPDVIFIEDIVTNMIQVLDNHNDIGVVTPRLLYKDMSFQRSVANFPSASQVFWNDLHFHVLLSDKKKMELAQPYVKSKDNRIVDWAYGAALLCRTSEAKEIKGFPTDNFMYGEDTEICMKFLHQLNKKTYYMYNLQLIHLGGYSENKVQNSKKIEYGTEAALKFVNKYYGHKALVRYRNLLKLSAYAKKGLFSIKLIIKDTQNNKNKKNRAQATLNAIKEYSGD